MEQNPLIASQSKLEVGCHMNPWYKPGDSVSNMVRYTPMYYIVRKSLVCILYSRIEMHQRFARDSVADEMVLLECLARIGYDLALNAVMHGK